MANVDLDGGGGQNQRMISNGNQWKREPKAQEENQKVEGEGTLGRGVMAYGQGGKIVCVEWLQLGGGVGKTLPASPDPRGQGGS